MLHSNLNCFLNMREIMEIIKKNDFDEKMLTGIKQNLTGSNKFRYELLKISSIIKLLDFRLNMFVGPVLNALFFWDIHQSIRLIRWIDRNKGEFDEWLHEIGVFDALMSFSVLNYNNPDWIYPDIYHNDEIGIETKDIGHPLIKDCIPNDYSMAGKSRFDIVTGSRWPEKALS